MTLPTRSMPASDDIELLRRMATGDMTAAGGLYDRYGGQVYRVAFRITGDKAAAEDCVLETFAQAWRQADRVEPAHGMIGTWLMMVAHSRALEAVRARRGRPHLTPPESNDRSGGSLALSLIPTDQTVPMEDQATRAKVSAAFLHLSAHQREVIELALRHKMSPAEMAQRLSVPLATITARLQHGMQKLSGVLRLETQEAVAGRKPEDGSRPSLAVSR